MPKYQFFCKPNSNRSEFTYLNMGSETYLFEKKELLSSGLEVDGDTIQARTPEEAIDKFKLNFCQPLEDYANSSVSGGLATFIFESFKSVTEKK
ncbi:hypothetical protein OKZ62_004233 [Vibrio navarrensis]|uniref:Uncharacterized protein n=1 Tax=Vibrio navarrensis TaxID=29495 RepID=A0AAI9CY96_9VIBR|nr:hypothetical protein [Vibrio navarrensis]EKA5638262.1 hypothetical protein [Vibrio navarrensis]ELN6934601.1 hypothetical protein [Vibrio navarrensis]